MGSPLQPELEDVIVTSTLNNFVSSVVPYIIVLILLEQIFGVHGVATS